MDVKYPFGVRTQNPLSGNCQEGLLGPWGLYPGGQGQLSWLPALSPSSHGSTVILSQSPMGPRFPSNHPTLDISKSLRPTVLHDTLSFVTIYPLFIALPEMAI